MNNATQVTLLQKTLPLLGTHEHQLSPNMVSVEKFLKKNEGFVPFNVSTTFQFLMHSVLDQYKDTPRG